MTDWQTVRLGEVADFTIGYPFKSTGFTESSDDVRLLRGDNVAHRRVRWDNVKRWPKAEFDTLSQFHLAPGDIVLAMDRPWIEAGLKWAVLSPEDCPSLLVQRVLRLRARTGISQRFIGYILATRAFTEYILSVQTGTAVPHISAKQVANFEFRLPDFLVQEHIGELLSAFDDKIELNRRMNETLEAMAQAIFRDWFVDFGPVRRKLAGITDPVAIMGGLTPDPARAAELAALFPDRFGEDELPEGWSDSPLSAHFEIIGGGTPKTSVPEYWGGEIPWFSVVDTPSGSDVFVFNTEKTITPEGLSGSSARLIPAGTTIISARGTVGNLAVSAREMTFNQSCYALRSTRGKHDCFVYLLAANTVKQLKAMAHGSVFSTITRQTFDALSFINAPLPVLESFEAMLMPLFDRIKAAVDENRTLAETRDYLLPRLMSGEVRVGDVAQELAA